VPKKWQPFRSEPLPDGSGILFHNNRYHVILRKYPNPDEDKPDIIHLSIRDDGRSAQHDWRDFQRIKNEVVGPETEMVEMYPRNSQVVDYSNQYHLWGFVSREPVFTRMGLCWEAGRRIWNGIDPRPTIPGTENSVQRRIMEER
jgi:hypothetical protein